MERANSFGERIRLCRNEKKLSQQAAAKSVGMSQAVLSQIENGAYTSSTFTPLLAELFGVEAMWLATGRGRSRKDTVLVEDLEANPTIVPIMKVTFKLSAGIAGFAIEQEEKSGRPVFFRRDWLFDKGYKPENLFAVKIQGSSMETTLWDGDLVVINTADNEASDGQVFAVNYEGELVIKRMLRDQGRWVLLSDNQDQKRYPPKVCTEDVFLIGKAIYKQSEQI